MGMRKKLIMYLKAKVLLVVGIALLLMLIVGCGGGGITGASEETYRKEAIFIDLDKETGKEFVRNPDGFKGKKIVFSGSAKDVKQNGNKVEMFLTETATPLLINYILKEGEERIVNGDQLRIFGDFKAVSSKKVAEGFPEITVIEIDAKYLVRPAWGKFQLMYKWVDKGENNKIKISAGTPFVFKLSRVGITKEGALFDGHVMLGNIYFKLTANVNDDGVGKFEYIDGNKKLLGKGGTLKYAPKTSTFEIETAAAEQKDPWANTTVDLPQGKYTFGSFNSK